MIDIRLLTNRELVNLLHAADAKLHRGIAQSDALNARVNGWFDSLTRANTALSGYISHFERKAIDRDGAGGIG